MRRHDRQRQDGPLHLAARRGGDRRHPGASPSIPRATSATCCSRFPTSRRPTFAPWIDADEAARAGTDARRVRREQSGARGRRASPSGARTARASRSCATPPTSRSTRRAASAGLPLSILESFDAPPPEPSAQTTSACASAVTHDGHRPARAARRRRRSGAEPRAHPARRPSCTTRGATGRTSISPR